MSKELRRPVRLWRINTIHKARLQSLLAGYAYNVVVHTALFWILVHVVGLHILPASLLATEVAIISNFALCEQQKLFIAYPARAAWQRFVLFNSAAFSSIVITVGTLLVLTSYTRMPMLLANIVAVSAAAAWNHVANSNRSVSSSPQEHGQSFSNRIYGFATTPNAVFGMCFTSGMLLSGHFGAWTFVMSLVPASIIVVRWRVVRGTAVLLVASLAVFFTTIVFLAQRVNLAQLINNWLPLVVSILALVLFVYSLFSLYLMLYSWSQPEQLSLSRGPDTFIAPQLSFTVLLPARHEEAVIYETIHRVWSAHYSRELLEIVVICHADDVGTIAEAQRAIQTIGSSQIRVETFTSLPINKPHGLNVGLQRTKHDIVTIFDAEDDIDSNIFNVINTIMVQEGAGVVQAGVQLMNFRDHWFGIHNCLEYFFWFKSRLHFHAKIGMIPLGGNTVFIRRDLLERVGGWDEGCLTEDADVGIRLSVLGEPIRVVYDAHHVTREETPDTTTSFVKQRTRWHQGFLQVLRKADWQALPQRRQRWLAAYTLSYPLFQGIVTLFLPVLVFMVLWLKFPVTVTMIAFLPLYALLLQLATTIVGAWMFTREYNFKMPLSMPLHMALTYIPFQILQGISAIRAVYRELRKQHNWEKTAHTGAHRQPHAHAPATVPLSFNRLLDDAVAQLSVERASVLALDINTNQLFIVASRGLPQIVVESTALAVGEGVAGWVAQHGRSLLIQGREGSHEVQNRLTQPQLCSAIVVPIERNGCVVGVVCIASSATRLGKDQLQWLHHRLEHMMSIKASRSIESHKQALVNSNEQAIKLSW